MFKGGCCGGGAAPVDMNMEEKHDKEIQEKNSRTKSIEMELKMTSYKLTYFNARIGGEMIRLILHYAGVPFEDIRIEEVDWPGLKFGTSWGKLPVLEFDGEKVYSSTAISRLLARRFSHLNLMGKGELESAKCDELVEICQDLRFVWGNYYFADELVKPDFKKKLESVLGEFLPRLESLAGTGAVAVAGESGSVGGSGCWLVGDGMTWADIFLANFLDVCEDTVDDKLLEAYPTLKKLKQGIFSQPKIKEYVDKRPKNSH